MLGYDARVNEQAAQKATKRGSSYWGDAAGKKKKKKVPPPLVEFLTS